MRRRSGFDRGFLCALGTVTLTAMPIFMTKVGSASTVAITGDLRGTLVNCVLRPDSSGLPAAGKYHISKPADDPIYGQVATMSPSGDTTANDDWENTGATASSRDDWSLYVGTGLTTNTSELSTNVGRMRVPPRCSFLRTGPFQDGRAWCSAWALRNSWAPWRKPAARW